MTDLEVVVGSIIAKSNPMLKHNETIEQINQIFRKEGFFTTKEYPIFKIEDGSGRAGRIDLIARKGKFRIAVEYDHHNLIKWKSFQKIVQIKPEIAIAITGMGNLEPNLKRAAKYKTKIPLYLISLKERRYEILGREKDVNIL